MKSANVLLAAVMLVFLVHGHALLAKAVCLGSNTHFGRRPEQKRAKQMVSNVVTHAIKVKKR